MSSDQAPYPGLVHRQGRPRAGWKHPEAAPQEILDHLWAGGAGQGCL